MYSTLDILLRPFGFDCSHWFSNLLILGIREEGYSRNAQLDIYIFFICILFYLYKNHPLIPKLSSYLG